MRACRDRDRDEFAGKCSEAVLRAGGRADSESQPEGVEDHDSYGVSDLKANSIVRGLFPRIATWKGPWDSGSSRRAFVSCFSGQFGDRML